MSRKETPEQIIIVTKIFIILIKIKGILKSIINNWRAILK